MSLVALMSASALAYLPLITDDTGTQGSDGNQLEFSYDIRKFRQDPATSWGRSAAVVYTRGVSATLDLYLATNYLAYPGAGFNSAALGGKWRFWENKESGQSLALKPEIRQLKLRVEEANGSETNLTSWGIVGIFSQATRFGEMHFNLAVDHVAKTFSPNERSTVFRISLAPVWTISEQWKFGVDGGLQSNPERNGKKHLPYGELGLVHSPHSDLDLALGVRRSWLDRGANSSFLTVGLTWRF